MLTNKKRKRKHQTVGHARIGKIKQNPPQQQSSNKNKKPQLNWNAAQNKYHKAIRNFQNLS